MRVAVVTDSTADLEPEAAAHLGIDVVPLFVNFGESSFRDEIDITRDEFYARLGAGDVLPTTTQASTASYAECFARLADAGREIVCVSISSALSGTINAAYAAAKDVSSAVIHIVDSRTVSAGLMLLVRTAAELAAEGKTGTEIVRKIEELRARQRLFAAIPDLSHAVRTGRVSKGMAMLGGIMKLSPVITLDENGKIAEFARVRTFERALETLVEATVVHVASAAGARIAIVHSRAFRTAEALRDRLLAKLTTRPARLEIVETGPAIAVHAGIGAAGIFSVF
ncbi:MAG TPA: DegV family protein [Candidatus Baltobacteraceae bacterium]